MANSKWHVHHFDTVWGSEGREVPPIETYGPGLLQTDGVGVLVADSNTGKTTLLSALARIWPAPNTTRCIGFETTPEEARSDCRPEEMCDGEFPEWIVKLEERRGNWRTRNLHMLHIVFEDADNMLRAEECRKHRCLKNRTENGPDPWVSCSREIQDVTAVRHSDGTFSMPIYTLLEPGDPLDLTDPDNVEDFIRSLLYHYDHPVDNVWPDKYVGVAAPPDIVVIDCLNLCIGAGKSINDDTTARAAIRGAQAIRDSLEAKLAIIVHQPTPGTKAPLGSKVLSMAADSVVYLSRKGDVLTAENTKARGFAQGTKRHYKRRVEEWTDYVSKHYSCVEFDEITDAPASAKAAPSTTAATPTASPAEPPPSPPEPAPAPKATAHPSERLKGRAAACWAALGLKAGESIGLNEAREICTRHPAFADVPSGRVANRWADVVGAWQTAGLVVDGRVVNPTT